MSELLRRSISEQNAGRQKLQSFMRGRVESNRDPLMAGRCKVRVFPIHGDSSKTPTADLPWCYPVVLGAAGSDYGDFSPPLVGNRVWVVFEMGVKDRPLYIGSWFSSTPAARKFGIVLDSNGNPVPVTGTPISFGDWVANPGLETPREAQPAVTLDPQRKVSKTPKGHTIIKDDRDGGEHMVIIDRAGQGIRFDGRVPIADNLANAQQRGVDSVFNGKAKPYANTLGGGAAQVQLADLASQSVSLKALKGAETVRVKSNPEADIGNPDNAGERHVIDLSGGAGRTAFDLVKGSKVVARIIYDSNDGAFILEADELITLRANMINLAADQVNVQGHLTASRISAPESALT